MNDFIRHFAEHLQDKEASSETVLSYLADIHHFAKWFKVSNGQGLALHEITPTDIRDCKSYLLNNERCQPATVNRRLSTLRRLCGWAKRQGLIDDNPTEDVKGVEEAQVAPRALEKREADKLVKYAERMGNKRNLAIIEVLRHRGIRISELRNLRRCNVEISERKGHIVVRSGKGGKYRIVALNLGVRKALEECIEEVRPKNVGNDHLFIGQRGNSLKPSAIYDIVLNCARCAGLHDLHDVSARSCVTPSASSSWMPARTWWRWPSSWDMRGWGQRRSMLSLVGGTWNEL